MSIFSRLSDIMNSNINSALDRAEDPEKMVRLMIQEMEDTLVDVRSTAAKVIAEKKEIERRLVKVSRGQQDWGAKAELAMSKQREDLARAALVEKNRLQESESTLRVELKLLDTALDKHEDDITKLESKLREVKLKRKSIEARRQTASAQLKVRERLHDGRVDEALARYDQMEKRIDETQGRVEAYDLGKTKSLAEEIADLEIESQIDSELEAIKKRLGESPASE